MNNGTMRRPETLRQVAEESASYSGFGMNLKDFLHEAAVARERGASLEPMLAEEPPRLAGKFEGGAVCDGFLAALADFLSRRDGLQTPVWAQQGDLALETPWFSPDLPGVRAMLLRDTPSAFKDRNIFIFESALQVA